MKVAFKFLYCVPAQSKAPTVLPGEVEESVLMASAPACDWVFRRLSGVLNPRPRADDLHRLIPRLAYVPCDQARESRRRATSTPSTSTSMDAASSTPHKGKTPAPTTSSSTPRAAPPDPDLASSLHSRRARNACTEVESASSVVGGRRALRCRCVRASASRWASACPSVLRRSARGAVWASASAPATAG
ncbi:hypothetical protein BC826DRAFT_581833 [Russula brevipes]|nr:hypothetical protein BC826DRAFT_581833 [Russula brevipes]